MQKIQQSVVGTTQRQRKSTWDKWLAYCDAHGIPSTLEGLKEPHAPLLVFAMRWRSGAIASSDDTRGAASVSSALAAVGKTIERMVNEDPRKVQGSDNLIHQLRDLYATFKREDPAPKRAWPVPTTLIINLDNVKHPGKTNPIKNAAVRDLTIMGFFYLLRPGEHAHTRTNELEGETLCAPFVLQDLRFTITSPTVRNLQPVTALTLNDLNRATKCTLVFSDQKNSVKGEYATHSSTGHPIYCPVRAAARRAIHLMENNAPGTTPLHTFYSPSKDGNIRPRKVTNNDVTKLLRAVASNHLATTGVPPEMISARSLRAGGATAMLDSKVDDKYLRIFGRWRSDAMFHYFRTTSLSYTEGLSRLMLANTFRMMPEAPEQEEPDLLPEDIAPRMLAAYFHYENGGTYIEEEQHLTERPA